MSRSVEEIGMSRATRLREFEVYHHWSDLAELPEDAYLAILARAERDYAGLQRYRARIRIINDAAVEHSARRAVHLQTIRQGVQL